MPFYHSVTDVARHFADYINRVSFRGESFVLTRGNKPIAELRPVPTGKRLGDLPGLLASLPRLSAADAESFGNDLDAARSEMARAPLDSPWESKSTPAS